MKNLSTYAKLIRCLEAVRQKTDFVPQVALILGSGLGSLANEIDIKASIPYESIEGFPVSTVQGHEGRFVFGDMDGIPVVIMQGRVHFYEGYDMRDVVLPVRLMGLLGAKALLITNAAGGLNFGFSAGDFMLITDQISNFVPSPLTGPNVDELGTRFPDMSAVYDRELRAAVREAAATEGIPLQQGVYVQLTGPNFESPAEVRMCRLLGGDAVGMSTAAEAIAAHHMGLRVCGVSCISNLGCGMTGQPLSHQEVQETADRVAPLFRRLVRRSVVNIAGTIRNGAAHD